MPSKEEMLQAIEFNDARCHIANQFPVYASPLHLGRFLMRYELMRRVQDVHGVAIECGVKFGAGLMSWFQIARLLEPHNWTRFAIGFDTFEGFPSVHSKDGAHEAGEESTNGQYYAAHLAAWGLAAQKELFLVTHDTAEMITPEVKPLLGASQVQIVKGDFMQTGPAFIERAPWLVVSLLYLDFDIYEPTKLALELFVPRMPRGAIIAFDELNHPDWPGETLAALEALGLKNLRLQRFPFVPTVSYAVL